MGGHRVQSGRGLHMCYMFMCPGQFPLCALASPQRPEQNMHRIIDTISFRRQIKLQRLTNRHHSQSHNDIFEEMIYFDILFFKKNMN